MKYYFHVDRLTTPNRVATSLQNGFSRVDKQPTRPGAHFYVDTNVVEALDYVMGMSLINPEPLAQARSWGTYALSAYTIYKIHSRTHNPEAYRRKPMLPNSSRYHNLRLDFSLGAIKPQEIAGCLTVVSPLPICAVQDKLSDRQLEAWHQRHDFKLERAWKKQTLSLLEQWKQTAFAYAYLRNNHPLFEGVNFRIPRRLKSTLTEMEP